VEGAAAALAVLERRLEKTVLRAPADGVVSVIIAEVGENLTAGQPLAFAATGKQWLSFNTREDLLHDSLWERRSMSRGRARMHRRPPFTELVPLGPFATWHAERAVGDHDYNTLRLRLDLQRDAAAFEPGMTVWFSVALGGMWFCQLGCCGRTRAQSEFISEAHRLSKYDA
jgi:HlyD family secretion protein